jgi:hypothetical protein
MMVFCSIIDPSVSRAETPVVTAENPVSTKQFVSICKSGWAKKDKSNREWVYCSSYISGVLDRRHKYYFKCRDRSPLSFVLDEIINEKEFDKKLLNIRYAYKFIEKYTAMRCRGADI